jgi:hypothetical protein
VRRLDGADRLDVRPDPLFGGGTVHAPTMPPCRAAATTAKLLELVLEYSLEFCRARGEPGTVELGHSENPG